MNNNPDELKTEILVNEEDIINTSPQAIEISSSNIKITPSTIILIVVSIFSITMMFYNNYNSNKGQIEYLTTISSGEQAVSEEEKAIILQKQEEKNRFIQSMGVLNESIGQLDNYYNIDNSAVLYQRYKTKNDAVKALARTQYHSTKFSDLFSDIQKNLLIIASYDESYITDGMKREIVRSIVQFSEVHQDYYMQVADKLSFIINNYEKIDFTNDDDPRLISEPSLIEVWESNELDFLSVSAQLRALNNKVKDNIKNATLSNT